VRHLLDTYIRADDSELVTDFADLGLIELIVEKGLGALESSPGWDKIQSCGNGGNHRK
jgi:type I restriction enzyme R subunit